MAAGHSADGTENQDSDDELSIFGFYATNSDRASKGYHVEVELPGERIDMEVDTAADFSIMSRDTYVKRFKSIPLQDTDVKLKTYTGEVLRTCDQKCKVVYSGQEHILPMTVAENEGNGRLCWGGIGWKN